MKFTTTILFSLLLVSCTSEMKKSDLYSTIKNDPLFHDYLVKFKQDNIIFADQSIYFDKVKKKEYFKCYTELFASKTCDFKDHSICNAIHAEKEFLTIVENKCQLGKIMIELKAKYPSMDKGLFAKLIDNSYENGLAVEMLNHKKRNRYEK